MKNAKQYLKERANIGPCMDVKAYAGYIYAIQRSNEQHTGRLCVLKPDLSVLSIYEGIGNARQIEIVGNVAVITAREDGVWIFDISDVAPVLLSHYHSVEYATGVALYGNLAFISCRQYGVEVIDISEPTRPKFVNLIRVGEVQSATVDHDILYCGTWGEMKVIVVDVSDPSKAHVISEIPLQGQGDGVHVHNGILYAATGQNARGIKNMIDENDPAYGMGNGLELFDVSNPLCPKRIDGILFEKGYCVSIDMWEASVCGDTILVNNSILGVFGISRCTMEIEFRLVPPSDDVLDAVTGVSVLDGDVFVATAYSDLFVARGLELAEQPPNCPDVKENVTACNFIYEGRGAELSVGYSGAFPVLAADTTDSMIVLACAEGGVHLVDKQSLELRFIIHTNGNAKDVKCCNNKIYVAEGLHGVEIFEMTSLKATKIGGFPTRKSVNQIAISKSGQHLMCGLAANEIKMYDVSNPVAAVELYAYTAQKGPLYGNNFASNIYPDGSMIAFCHRDGLITTNPDMGVHKFTDTEYIQKVGFCSYCAGEGIECFGEQILFAYQDGYYFLSEKHVSPRWIDEVPFVFVQNGFKGLLTIKDDLMIAANRAEGRLWVIDIANIYAPKVIAKLRTNASPAKAIFSDSRILIPGGRLGLLACELNRTK